MVKCLSSEVQDSIKMSKRRRLLSGIRACVVRQNGKQLQLGDVEREVCKGNEGRHRSSNHLAAG